MGKSKSAIVRLDFSGRLTIHAAQEHKNRMADALRTSTALTLAIHDIESIDLSFLQLLCALHRSARRDKKPVALELPVDPRLRTMMARIGYERKTSCTEEGDESCFWKTITEGERGDVGPPPAGESKGKA